MVGGADEWAAGGVGESQIQGYGLEFIKLMGWDIAFDRQVVAAWLQILPQSQESSNVPNSDSTSDASVGGGEVQMGSAPEEVITY